MKTLTLKENRDQIYRTGPVQFRTLLTFEDKFCQKNMEAIGRSHFIFQPHMDIVFYIMVSYFTLHEIFSLSFPSDVLQQ